MGASTPLLKRELQAYARVHGDVRQPTDGHLVLLLSALRRVVHSLNRSYLCARCRHVIVDLGQERTISEIGVEFGDAGERLPKVRLPLRPSVVMCAGHALVRACCLLQAQSMHRLCLFVHARNLLTYMHVRWLPWTHPIACSLSRA